MNTQTRGLPVAIIGAGPVGLAAAAELVQRGFTPLILEAGHSIAANLLSYHHVRLFSPWRYNIAHAARKLLEESGWQSPEPEALPTAGEIITAYLQPLAQLPSIAPHLHLAHHVVSITRQDMDKLKTKGRESASFVLRVRTPDGECDMLAQAVIDAAGTWSQLNPMGANGLPALGETEMTARIAYGMPDILGAGRARYAGKRVLVVGAGHSAAGSLIALGELAAQEPATSIAWALRGNDLSKVFGGGDADQLPARGQLGKRLRALQQDGRLEVHPGFHVHSLQASTVAPGKIRVTDKIGRDAHTAIDQLDEIIVATGARPDLSMTRELRLQLDPWLESAAAIGPLIDPNLHSCGTVRPHGHRELAHPEPGYYTVGAKSYGRAPNFLMATGYEQVRSVVAALAGDMAAADAMQLDLPETGVCSVSSVLGTASTTTETGCCGGEAKNDASACCLLDEQEKTKGNKGCGCAKPDATAPAKAASCCS